MSRSPSEAKFSIRTRKIPIFKNDLFYSHQDQWASLNGTETVLLAGLMIRYFSAGVSGRGRNGNNQCFQCVQDRQSVRGRSQSFWLRCVSDDEVILMTKSVNMWNKGEHSGMLSICWGHVTGMRKLWKHWPSPYKAPSFRVWSSDIHGR